MLQFSMIALYGWFQLDRENLSITTTFSHDSTGWRRCANARGWACSRGLKFHQWSMVVIPSYNICNHHVWSKNPSIDMNELTWWFRNWLIKSHRLASSKKLNSPFCTVPWRTAREQKAAMLQKIEQTPRRSELLRIWGKNQILWQLVALVKFFHFSVDEFLLLLLRVYHCPLSKSLQGLIISFH